MPAIPGRDQRRQSVVPAKPGKVTRFYDYEEVVDTKMVGVDKVEQATPEQLIQPRTTRTKNKKTGFERDYDLD
jgi:hypothetical protein